MVHSTSPHLTISWDEPSLKEWYHSACLLPGAAVRALLNHKVEGYRIFDVTVGELIQLAHECPPLRDPAVRGAFLGARRELMEAHLYEMEVGGGGGESGRRERGVAIG